MKTKLNNTVLLLAVLIPTILVLNSCDVDHSLNANKYGKVYMPQARGPNNLAEHSAVFGFDTTQTIVYGAAYGGPKGRSQSIAVHFDVNAALVDSFNTQNLTSYPILPEDSYELSQTSAVIPAGEKGTPPLKLKLKSTVKVPEAQYLLPITAQVQSGGIAENKNLQTTYFLIDAHKFRIVADGHNYTAVFSDDATNPHYLYFIGQSHYKKGKLVWKYDIQGDSLLTGYPKKVTDLFKIPYPQTIPDIKTAVWFLFSAISPSPQLYIFGNKHYYTYDIKTQAAGPLHPIEDLSTQPWPPKDYPKRVECAFYTPPRHATYLFTGHAYEKIHTGPLRAWFYPNHGHTGVGGPDNPWPGIPNSFAERGFSGCYYERTPNSIHFFSGDEFVIYRFPNPGPMGSTDVKKIKDVYKGL